MKIQKLLFAALLAAPLVWAAPLAAQNRGPSPSPTATAPPAAVVPGQNGQATGLPTALPPGAARIPGTALPPGLERTRPSTPPAPEPEPEPETEPEEPCETTIVIVAGQLMIQDCDGNLTPVGF